MRGSKGHAVWPVTQAAMVMKTPDAKKKASMSIMTISFMLCSVRENCLCSLHSRMLQFSVPMLLLSCALLCRGLPLEQNATCRVSKDHTVLYTRHEIWVDCFMKLGGMAHPRPGELDRRKIDKFMDDHLYFFEAFLAPSAAEIVRRCDGPPYDKWITQQEFEGSTNRECLGDADAICHTRDVCEREIRRLREREAE